jgi:solute carrier family 41
MLGNLLGNLELCLSARLGTSANIGELDHRRTRRALLLANMTLLVLQALLIASLAGFISFLLGRLTLHRLGDGTIPSPTVQDAGLAVGEQEWHEGYTIPGFKQLVMVLATGMGAAGLSSAVLGSFMSSAIVLCRWMGVDPGMSSSSPP